MRRPPRFSRAAGFTLIEVVIAASLLALILAGLVAGLRTFGQTGSRLEIQAQYSDDLRLVPRMLRALIESASPRARTEPEDQSTRNWFHGAQSGLSWLGNMPARHGIGGLVHLNLYLVPAGSRHELTLAIAPYRGDLLPDWSIFEPRVLLDEVDAIELAYRGVGEAEWLANWPDATAIPEAVRIGLTVNGRHWPPLVIRTNFSAPRQAVAEALANPGRSD